MSENKFEPIDNFKGLTNPDSFKYFNKHLAHMEKPYTGLGFVLVGVFAEIDDDGNKTFPSFTYTVGIEENYGLPEFIITSVNNESAAKIINDIMHWVRTKDFVPEPYKVYNQFTNFKTCFVPVMLEAKESFMTLAGTFYENKSEDLKLETSDFNAYQIIWTDTKNNFPWEEEFEDNFIDDALCLFDEDTFDKVKDLK